MAPKPPAIGFAVAVAALAADRAHKMWMLGPFAIGEKGSAVLTPFLDLVLVWNRGISYGLLTQGTDIGRFVLIVLGIGGALLFGWWLRSARRLVVAVSLGLIIGGALSNVIDRVLHGAVADFFLFHIGRFQWYVFNIADVWIVAGVAGLMFAWATERPEIATEP